MVGVGQGWWEVERNRRRGGRVGCQERRLIPCWGNMSRDGGGRNYLSSSSSKTRVGGEEGTEDVCKGNNGNGNGVIIIIRIIGSRII